MQLNRFYLCFDREPLTPLGMGRGIDDQQDMVYYHETIRVGYVNV